MEEYKFISELKKHEEKKREDLNNFYTVSCSLIFGSTPFIQQYAGPIKEIINISNLFAILGLIITVSWVLSLLRIHKTIQVLGNELEKFEDKLPIKINHYLKIRQKQSNLNFQITIPELLVPLSFMIAFSALILQIFLR